MLISEAFNSYCIDHLRMAGKSAKTEESYRNASKLMIDLFCDINICQLSFVEVRKWKEHLSTWQRPDTVRGNITCLRMVLKFLAKRGLEVLDYQEIPVPKREKRLINFLTREEILGFIEVAGRKRRGYSEKNRLRNIAITRLIAASGIRVSELCSLNRNSIKNRCFTVVGKSRDPRPCFIDVETDKAIQAYLNLRDDNNKALFIAHQGDHKRITTGGVRRIFENICNNSDFENVHPHTLRHSFATGMLDKGVDLCYIGDMMGHVSLDTTKVYTHYSNKKLREIYETACA